ncbi:MAG: hypothetical protein JST54_19280 [Deltaproteobacteria bacterium]|nr:hypothetical protein [Deltaproteobacteria bacterium]
MAAWKVAAMVLLVIVPGGSLVLLAAAIFQAWKHRSGPFAWFDKKLSRSAASDANSALLQLAPHRA